MPSRNPHPSTLRHRFVSAFGIAPYLAICMGAILGHLLFLDHAHANTVAPPTGTSAPYTSPLEAAPPNDPGTITALLALRDSGTASHGKSASTWHVEGQNTNRYIAPASLQKIITGLVALSALGPDYTYTTYLFTGPRGSPHRNTIIKFTGDPTLAHGDLVKLLKPLAGTTLEGDVLLDVSSWRNKPLNDLWMIYETRTKTGRPVGAFCLDRNYVTVTVKPTKVGETADSILSLPQTITELGSSTPTAPPRSLPGAGGGCLKLQGKVVTAHTTEIFARWEDNTIKIAGTIAEGALPFTKRLSPPNLDAYALHRVSCVLRELNIRLKPGRSEGLQTSPLQDQQRMTLISSHTSVPLSHFIKPAMKLSDNHIFDTLFITLMYAHAGKPLEPDPLTGLVPWEEGNTAFHAYLSQHFGPGTPAQPSVFQDAYFADGSGLSRLNRVKPSMIYFLLQKALDKPYFGTFLESLPCPGEPESTLATATQLPTSSRGKTGNLVGTTGLAGYLLSEETTRHRSKGGKPHAPLGASDIKGIFLVYVSDYLPGSSWPATTIARWVQHLAHVSGHKELSCFRSLSQPF